MRRILGVLMIAAVPVAAEPVVCGNGISVIADDAETANKTCAASDTVFAAFETCDLGTPTPVQIEVVDAIEGLDCVGLFHCGEARIEILSPDVLDDKRDALTVFGHIPSDRLFDSIIHHELTHALYDATPCPYESCIASSEYFAYSQQIAALSPSDRAPIDAMIDPQAGYSRDNINAMILFMAPDRFVKTVWAHFRDRDDSCAYWQGLLDGRIVFDRLHP